MRTRIPLSAAMIVVGLVALDLAALRYATAPWESGQPLRQHLVNLLPMANALVIAGWSLTAQCGHPRRFTIGFLAGGSAALLLHAGYDWAYPRSMWAACDWMATRFPRLSPWLGEGLGGWLSSYTVPGRGTFVRLYPAVALVICLPEFIAAYATGLAFRKWSKRAPDHG